MKIKYPEITDNIASIDFMLETHVILTNNHVRRKKLSVIAMNSLRIYYLFLKTRTNY
jgi:hypothetical protein